MYLKHGDLFGHLYQSISFMNQMKYPYYHLNIGVDPKGQFITLRSENATALIDRLRVKKEAQYEFELKEWNAYIAAYQSANESERETIIRPKHPDKPVLNDEAIFCLLSLEYPFERSDSFLRSSENWTNF